MAFCFFTYLLARPNTEEGARGSGGIVPIFWFSELSASFWRDNGNGGVETLPGVEVVEMLVTSPPKSLGVDRVWTLVDRWGTRGDTEENEKFLEDKYIYRERY